MLGFTAFTPEAAVGGTGATYPSTSPTCLNKQFAPTLPRKGGAWKGRVFGYVAPSSTLTRQTPSPPHTHNQRQRESVSRARIERLSRPGHLVLDMASALQSNRPQSREECRKWLARMYREDSLCRRFLRSAPFMSPRPPESRPASRADPHHHELQAQLRDVEQELALVRIRLKRPVGDSFQDPPTPRTPASTCARETWVGGQEGPPKGSKGPPKGGGTTPWHRCYSHSWCSPPSFPP
eukprot:Sspe_Gene.38324::Locus_18473_Transcript_7_7_Confidence_0.400_Length_4497::g.38324::m.38324